MKTGAYESFFFNFWRENCYFPVFHHFYFWRQNPVKWFMTGYDCLYQMILFLLLSKKEFEIHFTRWKTLWDFSFSWDWSTSLLPYMVSTIQRQKILAKDALNCWQKVVKEQGENNKTDNFSDEPRDTNLFY